jgi:glycosyltransferase involved in cell wall biosynthesis
MQAAAPLIAEPTGPAEPEAVGSTAVRVLTVGNTYPPHHTGGYELVWRAAVEHVRAAGHEVRVLTTTHREETSEPDGPDVHRELEWYWRDHEIVDPGWLGSLRIERHNQNVLKRHLADLKPDVVAFWSMGALSLGMLEHVRRRAIPAVAFVHDDWLIYGQQVDGWYRRVRGRGAKLGLAARYVFVSESTRQRARAAGISLANTTVAHSGVDPVFLQPVPPDPVWGWRLLVAGRLDPRKGIDTAITALAQLPQHAQLLVAGGGDQSELARLESLATELGVAPRVRFTGPLDRQTLAAAYAASDAVVFPVAWDEPWGLVPLEAMGVGRPVVATGKGGSAEYLVDEENCLLFEAGDAAGLAAAITDLSSDAPLREHLTTNGFTTAAAHTQQAFNEAALAELQQAPSQHRRTRRGAALEQ